jgi:hypothetical protein
MPSNRRPREARRRPDAYSERTVEKLLSGHDWEVLAGEELTEAGLHDAWRELREELLDAWIAEHPGSRPWAWWRWDSPEPRRQVRPGPATVGPPTWFGRPAIYKSCPPSDMYEDERAYLSRLGLLLPGER